MNEPKKAEQPRPIPGSWDAPKGISAERKAELDRRQHTWDQETDHGERRGPLDRVELSGADVFWLVARALAGSDGDTTAAEARLRAVREDDDLRFSLDLSALHLEGAFLDEAHLEGAALRWAHLEGAALRWAHLEGADLIEAHLEGAVLIEAHLEGAVLIAARLEGANLGAARLEGANLITARLEGANLGAARLEGANLGAARLEGANLGAAHLEGANLGAAHLESKTFQKDSADLRRIRQWRRDFPAILDPADLRGAFFDPATDFTEVSWSATAPHPVRRRVASGCGPRLADVRWGGANLTMVEWDRIRTLQDERDASKARTLRPLEPAASPHKEQRRKTRQERIAEYKAAGRAYRLLFVTLRGQGLTAAATRYHFRAEIMDRRALWHERKLVRWLFSWLLGTFAGYGDYISRLFLTYAVVVALFAGLMQVAALEQPNNGPLSPNSVSDALVLSVTSFHGRGIQPPGLILTDNLARLAGAEAVFGLLIEGIFIAAFTRRVTGG